MHATEIDRADPDVRAALHVRQFERRQRTTHVAVALALFLLAGVGPFVAAPLAGDPGATVGAILASMLLVGCGVAVWPWAWSDAEREHHGLAAIWAQSRAGADEETAWDRYAAWAKAHEDRVELLLITRSGLGGSTHTAPSPFTTKVVRRIDADAIAEAAIAMDALRDEAAALESRAQERHLEIVAAAARKPYDDALRKVDDNADAEQRRAEAEMHRELADQVAAERRAQASAVARALRRP